MDSSEKNFEASIEASLLRDPLGSGPKDVSALIPAAGTGQIDMRQEAA